MSGNPDQSLAECIKRAKAKRQTLMTAAATYFTQAESGWCETIKQFKHFCPYKSEFIPLFDRVSTLTT